MLRVLLNFLRRPTLRFGMERDPRSPLRDPGFVSYLAQRNRKRLDTDFHDRILRGRKLVRNIFALALTGGCTWVIVESAKALSMF
ncbi:MAG: hypothetical protein ABIZ81_16740 [Opitutaceae bacterium]